MTLAGLFPLWVALCGCAPTVAGPRLDTVVILHTNDLHARLTPDAEGRGGWANVAAYLKRAKSERPDVLVLDAGDMTQGSPVSSMFMGVPIFEILNTCGYDAATLGNHEFDNGIRWLEDFKKNADFPLLLANVTRDGKTVADAPYKIFDVDGVKVGVLALTETYLSGISLENAGDLKDGRLKLESAQEAAERYLPELKKQADIVVALTHQGVTGDIDLAAMVNGFDVIIGGHSHTFLREPNLVNGALVIQSGEHGRQVGRLELTVNLDTGGVTSHTWRGIRIPQKELPPDPATLKAVQKWEAKVSEKMDVTIGRNPRELSQFEFTRRTAEIWKAEYKTDFAYHNKGGTRADLPEGDITIRRIYEILPFNNQLMILKLNARQVREMLGAIDLPHQGPLFTLVTNSYIGQQRVREFELPPERAQLIQRSLRDPVIEYIKKNGSMELPAKPVPAGAVR